MNQSIFGEIDECNGVSANVLFGQESNCGTGISDLIFDEAKFFANNKINVDNNKLSDDMCNSVLGDFIYDYDENDESTSDTFDLPNININIT